MAAPKAPPHRPNVGSAGPVAGSVAPSTTKVSGDDPQESPTRSAASLIEALASGGYMADASTGLILWLGICLERPLLVEGPAGVGKTELARAAARTLGRELVRLSCYEGLDEGKALYEWDYAKQMLVAQLVRDALAKATSKASSVEDAVRLVAGAEASFFDRRFLVPRPLLRAIESPAPVVLLIDEIDRADPEFEALVLELLADMQITIPEIGTVRAKHAPLVILTTNGTREMTDALRRRCLHAFVDYPSPERELSIVREKVPGIEPALLDQLVRFVSGLRKLDLRKPPSVGESIDWARALLLLGKRRLDPELVQDTLGVLLKYEDDRARASGAIGDLLA